MKRGVNILILLGLSIILGGCSHTVTNTVTAAPQDSKNWWTVWLAQPVCQPPCWQNITPGVTTAGDAVSALEKIPKLTILFKSKNGIDWIFNRSEEGGTLTISENGIVNTLGLSVENNKLFVKTIVTSYKYPGYVKPYDCRGEGMCSVLLIYSDLGLLVDTFIENAGTTDSPQFEILPNTSVYRIYFFEPGMASFQKLPFQDYDLLMQWQGYGKYP